MSLANSAVLSTPLDIDRAVREHFYSAEAEIQLGADSSVIFNLKLSQTLPTMSLTNAIDTTVFLETIYQMKKHVQLNQIYGESRPYELDVSRFSTMQPLSDWQKFQRVRYESSGRSCADAILNYLQNPQEERQLLDLGLAPTQLEANLTEADLEYVRRAMDRLRELNQEHRKEAFSVFQRQYPTISHRVLEERITQDQRAGQAGDNFYQDTLNTLNNGVIGQPEATKKMATLLASQRNQEGNRVFLFVGPTGVGKTELAKAISKIKNNRSVMFPMNQYQQETDVSRLFGSPPGYVSSTDKSHFAKEIDRFRPTKTRTEGSREFYEVPNLVLLFDEFEKAHAKVKQSLLTLFDEGHCVVNYTRDETNLTLQYDFKRCIIVTTSNLYQQIILNAFQQNVEYSQISEMFKQCNAMQPFEHSFSPELLGRMVVVPFGPIPRGESYQKLIRVKFRGFCSDLKEELACQAVDVENESLILSALENRLYGDGTDIRKLRGYFDEIKAMIYRHSHELGSLTNKKITFFCSDEAPSIKFSTFIEEWGIYHEPKGAVVLLLP